jgi:hypothetical protein
MGARRLRSPSRSPNTPAVIAVHSIRRVLLHQLNEAASRKQDKPEAVILYNYR